MIRTENPTELERMVKCVSNRLNEAETALAQALVAEAGTPDKYDAGTTERHLNVALDRAADAAQRIKNKLKEYADKHAHQQLVDALIERMAEATVGTITNVSLLRQHLESWMDDLQRNEIERAESGAGWDPNP